MFDERVTDAMGARGDGVWDASLLRRYWALVRIGAMVSVS